VAEGLPSLQEALDSIPSTSNSCIHANIIVTFLEECLGHYLPHIGVDKKFLRQKTHEL
jgi:hypothetical protein